MLISIPAATTNWTEFRLKRNQLTFTYVTAPAGAKRKAIQKIRAACLGRSMRKVLRRLNEEREMFFLG